MVVRRRTHPRWTGVLYVGVTLLLGLGAINSQNNLLFLVFGLAVAAIAVSGLYCGPMMMHVSVRREAPPFGAVGQPMTLRYVVQNRSSFLPAFAIRVAEASEARRGPAEGASILPLVAGAVAHVGPKREATVLVTVTPTRRGQARLRVIEHSSSFPFGIMQKSIRRREPQSVLIHPRTFRLRPGVATQLLIRGQAGAASVTRRGRGDEFFGLRAYSPGDSPRYIAWRPSARTGSLVVRETASTSAGCLWIFLNLNADADDGDALESAISLAASLAVAALESGKDVGLASTERGVLRPPAPGARQRLSILNALATLERGGADPGAARLALRAIQRAATVVVHAGQVDPGVGPPEARHLARSEFGAIVAGPDEGAPA